MKRHIALIGLMLTIALTTAGAAAHPSDSCDLGFMPASSTPAGAGVRFDNGPGRATLTACNNGSAVPAPGHTKASIDTGAPSVLLVVDGDPENRLLACSDGYMGARASGQGVAFYENADGGYTTRARPKNAQELAADTAADCTGM